MIAVGRVAEDLLPPYAVLLLAFFLARCLGRGRLTPEHCNWANWLVGNIVNPFFILQLAVDGLDLGKLDYRVLAADAVSKALISILILGVIVVASWRGTLLGHATRLDWFVTFFSLSTLTSTLAVGVPLTSALYGRDAETVVRQLAVFQTLVWFPIILLLFHVRKVAMQAVPAHGVDPAFGGGGAAIGDVRLQVDHDMEGENVGDGDAVAGDADLTAQVDHVEADDGAVDAGVGELELRDGAAVVARVGNLRPPQVRRVHAGVGELELPVQVGHVDDAVEVVVVEAANDDDSAGGAASDVDLPVETANDGGVPPGLEEMQPAAAVAMSSLPFLFMKKLYACVKFAMDMSSNPNIVAAIFGVAWPFATNRLNSTIRGAFEALVGIVPPRIGGLAMMFSMGLSLGHQERIIACNWTNLIIGQILKFVLAPIAMGISSKTIGLHGDTLQIAIMQAAVPQSITSFMYAKEFGLHPEVISTMVITGMLLAWLFLPLVYAILGLTV